MSENGKENLAQWNEIIQRSKTECASRGISMREWLRINRINSGQYYWYRKKLMKSEVKTESTAVMLPVNPKAESTVAAEIQIGNIEVKIFNNAAAEVIETLGRMLRNAL